jgi:hypothetical protein
MTVGHAIASIIRIGGRQSVPGEGFHVEENRVEDGVFHAGCGFRGVRAGATVEGP